MSAELTLIGRVAAGLIQTVLDGERTDSGCARFLIYGMAPDEVVAIVTAIEGDPLLSPRLEIFLPDYRFAGLDGVGPHLLTDKATAELRHQECSREGRLLVLTDESQMQSVAQVEKLDDDALLDEAQAGRWIDAASESLNLDDETKIEWQAALTGLLRMRRVGLRQVAQYVSATEAELAGNSSLPRALGRSLPALGLPRFDALFDDIPRPRLRHPSQWRSRLERHWRRDCYLSKRDPSQMPLPGRAKLREKLEELRDNLREEVQTAISAYIEAPDGTSDASVAIFNIDWSELQLFFEEAQKSEGRSIGQETFDFYKIRDPALLTDSEREYLKAFVEQRRQNPTKTHEDEAFHAAHAHELREDRRLAALWERFIFGQRVECRDLLDGLAQCVRRIYQPAAGAAQVLVVEGQERSKASFLPLNNEVCNYFATRYRGLGGALQGLVEFRNVAAFDYPEFREEIASYARRTPDSVSRRARQLSFKVWLETRDGPTPVKSAELRLVWEGNPQAVGMGLHLDIDRLLTSKAGTPLVRCRASRPGPGRRQAGGVDLHDRSTLEPEGTRERGCFAPPRSRSDSITKEWKQELASLVADELCPQPTADALTAAFAEFETSYRTALDDLRLSGFAAASLQVQAEKFGALLGAVVDAIDAPVALDRLLKPLLEIGVARLDGPGGKRPLAIVTPWQPLRLAAQSARWTMLCGQLAALLAPEGARFTDTGSLYFSELRRALAEPARPDLAVGWISSKPTVLGLIDALNDYSLHEPPVAAQGEPAPTNDNVVPIARQITEIVQNYLRLQPHEKDNLSVVLYNCDAAALPQAVVDSLRVEAEREGGDAMCQVILRHRDESRLGQLYQQLVSRDLGDDSLHASEATRDFMSRLRISIMVNTAIPAMTSDGPPLDIVFCHDVISRAATLGWVELSHVTRPAAEIDPGQWSRRRPIRRGDRDAMVYLACPAQPKESWDYLDAVAALHQPSQARKARLAGETLVPARQTTVQDPATRQILEETHRLGSWVVNFDDLLDRRQLMDSHIRIIRYKHAGPDGRSLVISSQAPDQLLRATLKSRIKALDPSYTEAELVALSGRLIDDANSVSGDIVLRAAKRGSNANELIGVVLSKFLIDTEIGADSPRAWIFLDDYAAWLGQDEKRIADLLCLAPDTSAAGDPVLRIVVTEAKYISAANAAAKAGESARQLRDTLARLEGALLSDSAPADGNIWRARLSDMLLDGLRDPSGNSPASAADWRVALRDGTCEIELRGYSHVFAHAAPGVADLVPDQYLGVPETKTGHQERYSPETLRQLLRCYAERKDPTEVRAGVIGDGPASGPTKESPSVPDDTPSGGGPEGEAEPGAADEAPGLPQEEVAVPPEAAPQSHFRALIERLAEQQTRPERDDAWLEEVASRCRNALLRYGMSARLEQKVLTPNAALLKFKGSDELTVAAVERRLTELETTHGLEVLSVRAEPGLVAISIRRANRELLTLPAVWKDWHVPPGEPNSKLLIGVKEEDGSPLFLEPVPAPHTLVAGSTGSGKSVLVQNILLGIAATNRPDQAEITLIDPKAGVDYFAFEELPHLTHGIIDDTDAALTRLSELVAEMERRYALFKSERVSNIHSYHQRSGKTLPAIWLVHDEFADWMQIDDYRAGVEAVVSRLGVKARAAGIYLIFAAQRPDATVFPMQLRSNLGNRLVLRVDSAGTSDLSLGMKGGGAERLLGKGHLAAILGGGTEPVYAQVPFIGEDELPLLVRAIVQDLGQP
ncbi:MAG TPA: FtsK/SpoIIIE domain-containing protein [Allosphingosinicella sp.]|nr:FtsK/SpoIIIE domain-containing protein [Allosphingosinicella sp.]